MPKNNNEVYVLLGLIPHEGQELLGIYSSREKLVDAIKKNDGNYKYYCVQHRTINDDPFEHWDAYGEDNLVEWYSYTGDAITVP